MKKMNVLNHKMDIYFNASVLSIAAITTQPNPNYTLIQPCIGILVMSEICKEYQLRELVFPDLLTDLTM